MKSKRVLRFECDHCKKRGYSAAHMARHERACTKNPKRICGICAVAIGQTQPDIEALKTMVLASGMHECEHDDEGSCSDYVPEGFTDELRKAAGRCPMCMIAAVRQSGMSAAILKELDLKKELADIWAEHNEKS